jgi:pimeloyl-ACP methyl ester carboxylesterase
MQSPCGIRGHGETGPGDLSGENHCLESGRYHLWSMGDPEAPAIVLIHGLGWDALRLWRRQMAVLAASGWFVLAPDLLGAGRSGALVSPRRAVDIAGDLADIIKAKGIFECAVVGFSMGGAIAIELAAREHSTVRAAVFCCCSVRSSPEADAAIEAMLERAAMLGARRFASEQAEMIWHPHWAATHPTDVESFVSWRSALDQDSLFNAFRSNLASDMSRNLAAVHVPSLVIAADTDRFVTAKEAEALAGALLDADFLLLENCGHMAPIEQPALFNQALEAFLPRAWPAGQMSAA